MEDTVDFKRRPESLAFTATWWWLWGLACLPLLSAGGWSTLKLKGASGNITSAPADHRKTQTGPAELLLGIELVFLLIFLPKLYRHRVERRRTNVPHTWSGIDASDMQLQTLMFSKPQLFICSSTGWLKIQTEFKALTGPALSSYLLLCFYFDVWGTRVTCPDCR